MYTSSNWKNFSQISFRLPKFQLSFSTTIHIFLMLEHRTHSNSYMVSGPVPLFYSAWWVSTVGGRSILGCHSYTGTAEYILTIPGNDCELQKYIPLNSSQMYSYSSSLQLNYKNAVQPLQHHQTRGSVMQGKSVRKELEV